MDWVNIYKTDFQEATIIKGKLESEGIPAVLKYESFGKITGLNIDGIGAVDIYVPQNFKDEALKIINEAKGLKSEKG